jgi:hypothetical protein
VSGGGGGTAVAVGLPLFIATDSEPCRLGEVIVYALYTRLNSPIIVSHFFSGHGDGQFLI